MVCILDSWATFSLLLDFFSPPPYLPFQTVFFERLVYWGWGNEVLGQSYGDIVPSGGSL